jgi:hypothetical protein
MHRSTHVLGLISITAAVAIVLYLILVAAGVLR